jgi:hypothetical protein
MTEITRFMGVGAEILEVGGLESGGMRVIYSRGSEAANGLHSGRWA